MTTNDRANEDPRREEARRLRVEPGMSLSQLREHFGVGSGTLSEWLRGIEPPTWTRRPNAKDDLREVAIEMRRDGNTVPGMGTKAKPWMPNSCRITFINSDPGLVLVFLRFLELMGEDRRRLSYRIHIHVSADVEGAGRWWADLVGVPFEQFARPTLKTHNPSTVRHNVGDSYRGCLIVRVPRSRELYWRIEGLVGGITGAGIPPGDATM
jgi:hypothetical protein